MPEIRLPQRALRLVDGAPDVARLPCDRLLDEGGGEYMRRWYLSGRIGPQERFHQITADDPGRDFHDHPWDYTTRLLSGAYIEHTPDGDVMYGPGDVLVRSAESLHRLELIDGPVWTYFVTGRWRRRWGFMTGHGWVPQRLYHGAGRVTGCDSEPGRAWLSAPLRHSCDMAALSWPGWQSWPGRAGRHTWRDVFSADEIAVVVYEAIRGYNHVIGDPWLDPPWPGALPFHRGATLNGVHAALAGKDPRQLHEAWCEYYAREGWVHGDVKDAWALPWPTHPSLVKWTWLPEVEQLKYEFFRDVVLSMARLGK